MKKLLAVIFAFTTLLLCIGLCSCAKTPTEGLSYKLLEDKTYEVSVGKATTLEEIVIPGEYKGAPVTKIADMGFKGCGDLKTLYISSGVIEIGAFAFYDCDSLEEVTLPKTLTDIKESAFEMCKDLEKINFPKSLKTIGAFAFASCTSLEEIEIKEEIKTIQDAAFSGCTDLKTVEISENLSSMGSAVFADCTSIESITLPFIGSYAKDGENTFKYAFDGVVPESVKTVKILGGRIGEGAFKNIKTIETIEIADGITAISKSAFDGCTGIKFNEYKNALYVGNSKNPYVALLQAKSKDIKSCKIAKGTRVICKEAFEGCTNLEEIKLTSKVMIVEEEAFNGCKNLKEIYIPESVTTIGEDAFDGCMRLTVHCEAEREPRDWSKDWNPLNRPVVWNE